MKISGLKKYLLVFVLFFIYFIPPGALAGPVDLTISPLTIEASGKAGELLEYSINIENNEDYKAVLYPVVKDFYSEKSDDAVERSIDGSESPYEWIKIQRSAIRLMPGEKQDIDIKVDIRNNAVPGIYSAKIFFPSARNRSIAEKKLVNSNEPEIIINIKVSDHIVKSAEITNFRSDKFISFNNPVGILFNFKNLGNREMNPAGDLSIYNNRNQEIETIDLKDKLSKTLVNEDREVFVELSNITGFGKYKAKIRIDYNDKTKNLQDVVYFTFLPWQKILILGFLLFLILLMMSYKIFKNKSIDMDYQHSNYTREEKEHTVNLRRDK